MFAHPQSKLYSSSLSAEFMGIARANPLSMSLRSVFEELDVDGDGHITRSELRTAFERMGHSLSDEEIKSIYRQVDLNQDGKINFDGTLFKLQIAARQGLSGRGKWSVDCYNLFRRRLRSRPLPSPSLDNSHSLIVLLFSEFCQMMTRKKA